MVDFRDAAIKGQAPDKGLYFPQQIPVIDQYMLQNIETLSNEEIAFLVIQPYVGNSIPVNVLRRIVGETVNFPFPLININDRIFALELFHGPTLAFKDVGARFMSRCFGYFVEKQDKKVTVLVATSGDTGGAVANGFYGVDGVDVVILYPSGKVSAVQEKQLTTLGKNIHALEVDGTFDDCQQMVKQAFADKELTDRLFLTSANSINVARWLPQQFYYFFAYKQWNDKTNPPVICVPSGNFGNICAGILAHQSGLPVAHFIAACNANDTVTRFLAANGSVSIDSFINEKSVSTLSNAMDVGNPSNFIRILEIFQHQFPVLKEKLSSYSITNKETIDTIKNIYENKDYLLDPHGAVGYLSLQRFIDEQPAAKGIFLETAHPVKFPDAIEKIIGKTVDIPASVQAIMTGQKQSLVINAEYASLKDYLLR